jgi:glucose-fructose oxidoreductase
MSDQSTRAPIRVIGVGFDHMHIGDQLRLARDHADAIVVGAIDSPDREAAPVLADLGLDVPVASPDDWDSLVDRVQPDVAFVCSTTAAHPEWVERLASRGVHTIVEKPMAFSLEEADAMVAAAEKAGVVLAVNWPLAWIPAHRTARRLVADGAIGTLEQVHFYDGNRGPLYHSHGKTALHPTTEDKERSWWYDPAAGGGSLRDYLGYGTTLATWFLDGELPTSITAVRFVPDGLRVDEQAIVIAQYSHGLSAFETRWGTHTDPWTLQPQPRCGFVLNGSRGSISSWDYDDGVTLHSDGTARRVELDPIPREDEDALSNLIAHLRTGRPLDGPMTTAVSRSGQLMVETALRSVESGRTERLDG